MAAGPGQYSSPVWLPLRQAATVGCVVSNCSGPYHNYWALDLLSPGNTAGAPIYAAGAGQAFIASSGSTCGGKGTVGNSVRVDHGGGVSTYYYHLASFSITNGQWVDQNTVLGAMGSTGYNVPCPTNHLHFEKRVNGSYVDPGPLQACHGASLVTYPQAIGFNSWNSVPYLGRQVRSDGTGCGTSAPPVAPTNVKHLEALGRVGLSWTASAGAVAYDVYRDSAYLGAASGGIFYDRSVSDGQTYNYAVYARNQVGARSPAATVQVRTDAAKAADRSWVAFKTGPALCGRVGDAASPRIGCTVQTSTGWRFIGLPRNTDWGYADARAWVPAPGGGISYCRTGGGGTGGYYTICTKLDPVTLAWGADVRSPVTDLTYSDSFA